MGFENIENRESLPEEHKLPLRIKELESHAHGSESTVWKVLAKNPEDQEQLIALKQIRKESFASEAEMQKSKEFYDFLKNLPEFGKFVPDTLYFKARVSEGDEPQAFALQRFIEGTSIDQMNDEELYSDHAVAQELLSFARASLSAIEIARGRKAPKPDFGTSQEANQRAVVLGNYFLNPRYSTNIVISEKPEHGQRVFFVDTGQNMGERMSKTTEVAQREIVGRLQGLQLKRWIKRLEEILEKQENMGGVSLGA